MTLIENVSPSVCSGREVIYEGTLTKSMCQLCGFVYTTKSPLTEEINKYYKEVYSSRLQNDNYDYKNFSIGKYFSEAVNDFVLSHEFPVKGKLLDIGCGKGFFEEAFDKKYPNWIIEGVDPSITSVEMARKKSPESTFHQRNFEGSEFEPDSYDLITMHTVLNRVPPRKFIGESAELLKTGGFMSISIAVFPEAPFELYLADHTCMYFKEHLLSLAEEFKMNLVKLDDKGSIWRFLFVKSSMKSLLNQRNLQDSVAKIKLQVSKIVESWQDLLEKLNQEKDNGGKVAFYGAGTTLMILLSQTQFPKEQIAEIYDDNPHKIGEEIWGIEVKKTDESELKADCGVLCAGPGGIEVMKSKMNGFGNLLYYK